MRVPFDNNSPLVHPTAFVADNAMVIGDVEIGEDSSVWFGSVVRGDVNYIRIGARTNIQDHTIIHVNTGTHPTILEDEITVGHHVMSFELEDLEARSFSMECGLVASR